MQYKKQHIVTKAYLKAWLDPKTPEGQYLWFVSRDEKKITRKSPKSIFYDDDFYTVIDDEGNRILELEHELQSIENKFIELRDKKLLKKKPLTDADMVDLVRFIATAYTRTKYQKSDQREIWEELLSIYKSNYIHILAPDLYKRVEALRDQPLPFFMFNIVNLFTPVLFKMNLSIFETTNEIGFITSDNPVIWFDPSVFIPNFPISFYGIKSPLLEIFFPISPNYLVNLSWSNPEGYLLIDGQPEMADYLNRMMVGNAEEGIILNHNNPKDFWFEDN